MNLFFLLCMSIDKEAWNTFGNFYVMLRKYNNKAKYIVIYPTLDFH